MKYIASVAFLFITLVLSGQQVRQLESFNKLKVGESIKVALIKGNKYEAKVYVDGVSYDKVETSVSGDRLNIEMQRGIYFSRDVEVILTYQNLEEIHTSSSAQVTADEIIKANYFDLKVSSSAKVDVSLAVNRILIAASSSGKVYVSGNSNDGEINANSSGKVYGSDFTMKELTAKASSSGKIYINVLESLNGKASSSGRIYYSGRPERLNIDTSSAGKIIPE